jgi:hypothetical protein
VQLRTGLSHKIHFEMVPESLWLFLKKYYRCNGSAICRKVTYRKRLNKPELDLYPVRNFFICFFRNKVISFKVIDQNISKSKSFTTTNASYGN